MKIEVEIIETGIKKSYQIVIKIAGKQVVRSNFGYNYNELCDYLSTYLKTLE